MDPILGLLFVLACWEGVKAAWAHGRDARRASRGTHVKQAQEAAGGNLSPSARRRAIRQHDAAWWGREATHGFPVYRTSWHSSWLAHRTALEQARSQREASRTSHLEARASILSGLREHRQRQSEAQKLIDKALEEAGQQAGGKKAVRETADELARKRAEKASAPPLPADGVQPTRRVDGQPETPADKRFFDHRDGNIPDPADPQNARALDALRSLGRQGANGSQKAVPPAASSPPATEGTRPMPQLMETNYTETINLARQLERDADDMLADNRWQQMGNIVDQLGSMLRGDTASLSEAADVADALKEERKALQKVHETAHALWQGLTARHGGIQEAANDAGGAQNMAKPEFYET